MIRRIRLTKANDLKKFMEMATMSSYSIGVHTEKNQIADAKAVLGLMALDYDKPLIVVTDDEDFLKRLDPWAVDDE